MPPFSKEIWQEGAQIKSFKIVKKGIFDEQGVVHHFYDEPGKYPGCSGTRTLADNISDLKAQVSSWYADSSNMGCGMLIRQLPRGQTYRTTHPGELARIGPILYACDPGHR